MYPERIHIVNAGVWCVILGICALCGAAGAQDDEPGLVDALVDGDVAVNLRLRFEHADTSSLETSEALTIRTRLGYGTKPYKGFDAYVEFEDITSLNDTDNYNQARTNPEAQEKTVIPELESTELNKVYLHFATEKDGIAARVGRQRILSGSCRYIPMNTYGTRRNIVWRQNEQTLDAATFRAKPLNGVDIFYAYVDNIYRPFGQENGTEPPGEKANAAEVRSDTHMINLRYAPFKELGFTCFAYLVDLGDGEFAAQNSSDTFGMDIAGNLDLGDEWTIHYVADYARQFDNDATTPDADFTVDYYKVGAGASVDMARVDLSYELLESDNGFPFRSFMATPHKLNGWADVFAITPDDGLADLSGRLLWKLLPSVTGVAKYHIFRSENRDEPYGRELDLLIRKSIGEHLSLSAKYASYSADSRADNPVADDVSRLWIYMDAFF